MDRDTFNKFRRIIYEKSGISLGESKEALVMARVGKRMSALGIESHKDYLLYATKDETGDELIQLLDVISTNVTSFFREQEHFHFLSEAVSSWYNDGQNQFRFWSAASSTGEEPYSLAITLIETLQNTGASVKILATDISTKVLDKCRIGIYEPEKLKDVSPELRDRYFSKLNDKETFHYEAKKCLKDLIVFTRLNLAKPPFPMQGPFDAIFCRNVMIYFDNHVRSNLVASMYDLLKPGGYLLIGHTESLTRIETPFQVVKPSIYIKK